jgi:hypothetical protein
MLRCTHHLQPANTARGAIGKAELNTGFIIRGQPQCITAFVLTFENAIGVLLRCSFLRLGKSC